jgi:two-component system LytT family response regulator
MILRVLLVDDEVAARARLRQMLRQEPDFDIVGECANGRQALDAIRTQHPDLVFLDIQMPGLNGLEVCRALEPASLPRVVFVTAYDRYAIEAFEVHAIDYLLKPFDQERFRKTLAHARQQLQPEAGGMANARILALLHDLQSAPTRADRLAFKSDGRVVFVRLDEIEYIEAEGNYAKIHIPGGTHLLRETMSALEGQLPPEQFLRLSRSVIVNLDRVKEVQPLFYGDHVVILRNGTRLTLTRSHRDRLDALLVRSK